MDYFNTFNNLTSACLTRRAEGDAPVKYENCSFTTGRSLEHYYYNRDEAGNPFSEMTIKGSKGTHWNWTINNNLKLIHNNVLAKSGAAQLKVKSGYAVELRITVGEEDFIIGKRTNAPNVVLDGSNRATGLIWKNVTSARDDRFIEHSWPITAYNDSPYPVGKEQIDVVLVGDSGDYLSMDLEGDWPGIAKFRLKLGNETYANTGIEDINGNSYIEVLGVCKIDETSESGTNMKIDTYKGYPIWRDERSTPFKIDVKGNIAGVSTVFTQEYPSPYEQEAAINVAKVWIDSQDDDGGDDDTIYGCIDSEANNYDSEATKDDGSCKYNEPKDDDDNDDGGCPDNATQNDAGQCECDAGYKLDSNTQTCVKKEDSMSNYIVLGGLALLGLALLG